MKRVWVSFLVCAGLAFAARTARALDAEECVSLHASGQDARENGKLTSARTSFLQCASEACPTVVREECARLLAATETSLPTVVFEARDASGKTEKDVEVSVDGNVILSKLGATAVGVDPGEHTFRFRGPGGQTVQRQITLLEGQKNQLIPIDFAEPASAKKPAPPTPEPPKRGGGIPTLAYVLGGVSVVSLGAFGYFALSGKSKQSDLEDTCAPRCPDSDYDTMRQRYLFADIALGVAVVSGGVATWLVLGSSESPNRVGVRPLPAGAAATYETRF
jgi:hypothetical protein